MAALESFVIDDLNQWQLEAQEEIKQIEETIEQSRKQIRINQVKMNVINHSQKELGHSTVGIDKHWEKYGKPLEEENARLRSEQDDYNSELQESKRSLKAIINSLDELFARNEVTVE